MARDEEPLGDGAGVESGEQRRDDVALAPRERVGAAEEIERLRRRCVAQGDGDLPAIRRPRAAQPRSSPIARRRRARAHALRSAVARAIAPASPPDRRPPAACPMRRTAAPPAGRRSSARAAAVAADARRGPGRARSRPARSVRRRRSSVVRDEPRRSADAHAAGRRSPSSSRSSLVESAIAAVAVCLDPAPASERVTARDRCDVADADRAHDLVPARRAREVAAGLGAQAPRRVGAPSEHVLRREIVARVLELERAPKLRAVVVLGERR